MFALAETLEKERISHAVETSLNHKETFGQYFTPYSIAKFMSSLFPATDKKIQTNSKERQSARAFGLETVNLKIWGESYNG